MPTLVYQSFTHTGGALTCDGVSVAAIVARIGTPVYIYSAHAIREAYRALDEAFAGCPHAIHYALKANSTLAIVRLLRAAGSKVDANSGGEIEVALRVNPDIDAGSHPNISTGLRINKFGAPLQEARAIYRDRRSRPGLRFVGVHVHIGSQITTADPLRRAARALAGLASELRADGIALEHVDVGGGLGIPYEGRPMIGPREYAEAIVPALGPLGLPVLLEPGRAIVGRAGALVARVADSKRYPDGRQFAVLDAGMAELVRPALYGSYHQIVPVHLRPGPESRWDVVGPICESSDVFARERMLPPLEVDDLVAILDAGAYGSVMASNYNRHLLPAEVLVDAGQSTVIRRRQTLDEVLSLEA